MNIPNNAVDAAKAAGDSFGLELTSSDLEQLLTAAAPLIAAQALRDAADLHDQIASDASYRDSEQAMETWLASALRLRNHADSIEAGS